MQQWRRCVLAIAMITGSGCGKDGGGGALVDGGDGMPDASPGPRDAGPDARREPPITSLTITPTTLMLDASMPQPVQFVARLPDGSPANVPISWVVTPKELGTINPSTGLFTPSGASGEVKITASAGSVSVTITLSIAVNAAENGDRDFGSIPAGAGGIGGVGGEGGGSPITEPLLRAALDAAPTEDATLSWLYPYDGTVWPRGLPAPLLQWKHGDHAPVAVKLAISVDDDFRTTLYLGPPMGVTTIDRIPIPQAVWRNGQLSGKTMKIALTYVANEGGFKTYKATRELTFTTAPTELKGIVYYNSYGTKLAENFGGAKGPGSGRFGGATLSIEGGSFDPLLAAGSTTPDRSGCRVCHTVAADGSTLIALHNDGMQASVYDLRAKSERMLPSSDDGKFGWAALYPDGSAALGASGPPGLGGINPASLNKSEMYRVSDGSTLTANGLSSVATQAVTPQFSTDGRKVVFNAYQGPGADGLPANGRSLFVMDVARPDANTFNFTNAKSVYTSAASSQIPGWPFFLPDNSGVVFELELAPGSGNEHLMTRKGARGELWWTDLAGHAHALDNANGDLTSGDPYLPSTASTGHADDTVLQYEPTVAPIVAGGYAWVVFTSRRLYGNVATRNPYESDAREYDLTPGNSAGPTTKKLWVSAIDIPARSDSDPSHPAFYLPAQELYAGNSRGFWTLDACKADGQSCAGGDECCNGYCSGGALPVCGVKPPNACAAEYDACEVAADCCTDGAPLRCIGGHCATTILL
jgi:hypothetical protein